MNSGHSHFRACAETERRSLSTSSLRSRWAPNESARVFNPSRSSIIACVLSERNQSAYSTLRFSSGFKPQCNGPLSTLRYACKHGLMVCLDKHKEVTRMDAQVVAEGIDSTHVG